MYSETDFEKLWFLYKTEGQPKGVSINTYCSMQGVSYKSFYDWRRKRQKAIVPVQVDGFPCVEVESAVVSMATSPVQREDESQLSSSGGDITISIHIGDGLHIRKSNLDYPGVKQLIERLEVLC